MSSNPNFFLRVSDPPLGASVAAKKYIYIYDAKTFKIFILNWITLSGYNANCETKQASPYAAH